MVRRNRATHKNATRKVGEWNSRGSLHRSTHRRARALLATFAWMLLVSAGSVWGQDERPPPPPPRHGGPPGGPGDGPPGGPPHHRRGPPPLERVLEHNAERIGLDPAVEEKIGVISSDTRATGERTREALDAAHEKIRVLLSADAPDESEVLEQADRIGALETESQKTRLRGMLRIRALLTAEQRAMLVEIHEERRSRRGERRHRPGRRDGPREPEPDGLE
jgi:Spy/CpxP family protein refolding chaperone